MVRCVNIFVFMVGRHNTWGLGGSLEKGCSDLYLLRWSYPLGFKKYDFLYKLHSYNNGNKNTIEIVRTMITIV